MRSLSRANSLFATMAAAGLMRGTQSMYRSVDTALDAIEDAEREKLPIHQASPRNTKSSLNYEMQKKIADAAEAKRLRRQSRNLANAGLTSVELI